MIKKLKANQSLKSHLWNNQPKQQNYNKIWPILQALLTTIRPVRFPWTDHFQLIMHRTRKLLIDLWFVVYTKQGKLLAFNLVPDLSGIQSLPWLAIILNQFHHRCKRLPTGQNIYWHNLHIRADYHIIILFNLKIYPSQNCAISRTYLLCQKKQDLCLNDLFFEKDWVSLDNLYALFQFKMPILFRYSTQFWVESVLYPSIQEAIVN